MRLENPGEVLSLNVGAALDLQRRTPGTTSQLSDGLVLVGDSSLAIAAGLRLDLDLGVEPLLDLVSELAGELGDALLEQVDDLFSGIELPSAEELACWRTLLPAIADLVASLGDRFQAGGDILDRLPDWIPPEPAALLNGLGDGLVGISEAIRSFQDTFLNPAALVERVNSLFRGADIPLRLSHSTVVGHRPLRTNAHQRSNDRAHDQSRCRRLRQLPRRPGQPGGRCAQRHPRAGDRRPQRRLPL